MRHFWKTFISVVPTALLFLALPAFAAEEEELAPGFNECMDHASSTLEMLQCGKKAYSYWDGKLNENYQQAKKACDTPGSQNITPEQCREKLLKMERNWLKYRDQMADFIYIIEGEGTLTRINAQFFLIEATKNQAKALAPRNPGL